MSGDMGNVKYAGFGHVEAMLKNFAIKVPEASRHQLERSAQKVVDFAQIFVPEKTGALRDSIRIEKSYGARGRLQINVICGGPTMVIDNQGNRVSLDSYALQIHERYETLKPGPGTIAKRAEYPQYYIGEQFLFRALKMVEERLAEVMAVVIQKVIREEGGQ